MVVFVSVCLTFSFFDENRTRLQSMTKISENLSQMAVSFSADYARRYHMEGENPYAKLCSCHHWLRRFLYRMVVVNLMIVAVV